MVKIAILLHLLKRVFMADVIPARVYKWWMRWNYTPMISTALKHLRRFWNT